MSTLELVHVPGVMPGKWLRRFAETHPEDILHARSLPEGIDPLSELATGRARLALMRYPEGTSPASPRLHVIPLYVERPVLVAAREHDAEYFDEQEEIPAADASLWPRADPAEYPPERGGVAMLMEVVASGAVVAVLPQSLARLHARKDVVWRYVEGEQATAVGLAWPRVDPTVPEAEQPLAFAALEDPLVEEFIGVVRGRGAGSSRQPSVREREQREAERRREERSTGAGKAKDTGSGARRRGAGSGGGGSSRGGHGRSGKGGHGGSGKGRGGRGKGR